MSAELVLNNAKIVLEDEIISGSILIRDGKIADISERAAAGGEDFEGDYLIPGLIELHTDHLEGHYVPRPRVRWNPIAAVLAHDAQIATSGITTVLDALRVGLDEDADMSAPEMRKLADAIEDSVMQGRLRADHYFHLRCEVSAPDCLEGFHHFDGDDRVRLASLMDHAPGQRQFVNLETYAYYYQRKLKLSDREFNLFCEKRMAESAKYSGPQRKAISDLCRDRGIKLASHDDATAAHVDEAVEQGIDVAEFPTTLEAAAASKQAGLAVLMGAPNVVRGGSHSGNVSARELAEQGHLDILSSDYIPFSLIQSTFFLSEAVDGITLPDAVRLVTKNPAQAIGFDDRGVIEVDKRADLVRVRVDEHIPVVRTVWREGRRGRMMAAMIERALNPASAPLRNGAFVAVVGPSGAGKDTIIDYARAALGDQPGYHFVRRVVTRPSSADAEDRDTLSEEQFTAAEQAGAFCHSWKAHGLHYGLPKSVDDEIERGAVAIANVSRGVLPALREAYSNLLVVHITASHDVLAQRLASRGRENADEIRHRLMRAAPNPCDPADAVMIDNSGAVSDAGDEFIAVLRKSAAFAAVSEQL